MRKRPPLTAAEIAAFGYGRRWRRGPEMGSTCHPLSQDGAPPPTTATEAVAHDRLGTADWIYWVNRGRFDRPYGWEE